MVGLLLLLLFLLDRLQWVGVGGSPARCQMMAGERLGVRGEGRDGWPPSPGAVMAVGIVVRGMTACLTVAAAHRRRR